jgi:signal recognition particle receptor subunit beta
MVKKKNKIVAKENKLYILPSLNSDMRKYISKFKVDMMEHVVSSIKFAVENKLPIVEVFQFKNTPFVVVINEQEFMSNLSHIRNYYMENEIYELCPRVEKLYETLKKNEKENLDSKRFNDN